MMNPAHRQSPPAGRGRTGAVTFEFIVVFPILLIATLAIFEFGILMTLLQMTSTAVDQGAREGAYGFPSTLPFDANVFGNTDPTVDDDVADRIALVMDEYLNVHRLEVRQDGINDDATRPNVYLRIVRGGVTAERGDLDLAAACVQSGVAATVDEVVVTMCFPLVNTGGPPNTGNPVPDLLSTFGFTLAPYRLEITSRQPLE